MRPRVVDAQRALLVCAEDEARAELLVEVAECEFGVLHLALDVIKRHTPAFEVLFKAWERMVEIFETHTSVYILGEGVNLGVGVVEHLFFIMLCTNLVVFLRNEEVGLQATRNLYVVVLSNLYCLCARCGCRQSEGSESERKLFVHINVVRVVGESDNCELVNMSTYQHVNSFTCLQACVLPR